jgi:hypothetical protein
MSSALKVDPTFQVRLIPSRPPCAGGCLFRAPPEAGAAANMAGHPKEVALPNDFRQFDGAIGPPTVFPSHHVLQAQGDASPPAPSFLAACVARVPRESCNRRYNHA